MPMQPELILNSLNLKKANPLQNFLLSPQQQNRKNPVSWRNQVSEYPQSFTINKVVIVKSKLSPLKTQNY